MSSHKNRVLAALLAGSALGGLPTAQADTFNVTLDT